MDAATLQPIRSLAARVCSLSDIDTAFVALVAKHRKIKAAADELARICSPGGQADRLAATLDDQGAAARYVQKIAATFAPFAEILRAVEVTGDGETWMPQGRNGYTRMTTAEAERHEQAKRQREAERKRREEQRMARAVVTYKEAAAEMGVSVNSAMIYACRGELVAVYVEGKRKAVGVTRASVEAYKERRQMRKEAARERAARFMIELSTPAHYWTEDGRKIASAEKITTLQIVAEFHVPRNAVVKASRRGQIAKVYRTEARQHVGGYLRESAEAWARAYKATVTAWGIYYTAAGQIVEAERTSRREAAAALHTHERKVSALAAAGQIERAYADPACTIPCGYTRRSVEAYAQAHPRHIPARRAKAIENFKIQIIPLQPRRHGLRAARLDPDTESAQEAATPPGVIEAKARHRRERPTIIFRLATWKASRPPDEPQQEEGQTDMDTPRQENATQQKPKLEVAKAYTIHDGGVIRAIAVSEADRDEIVAALELYHRAKAAPGEVESALKLLRTVRDLLDVPATAGTAAAATAATADAPKAAQGDGGDVATIAGQT